MMVVSVLWCSKHLCAARTVRAMCAAYSTLPVCQHVNPSLSGSQTLSLIQARDMLQFSLLQLQAPAIANVMHTTNYASDDDALTRSTR